LKTLADILNEPQWATWLHEHDRYRFSQYLEMTCFGVRVAVSDSTEDAVWAWGYRRGEEARYCVKAERVK
jgi:hypothetical protein